LILFSNLETFLNLRRIQPDAINAPRRPVSCLLFLSYFKEIEFPYRFLNGTQISNFVKIRPV